MGYNENFFITIGFLKLFFLYGKLTNFPCNELVRGFGKIFVSDCYKKLPCRLGFPASCLESGVVSPQIHRITTAANNSVKVVGYQVVFPDSPSIMPEDLYFI